jgi:hypothetical protein
MDKDSGIIGTSRIGYTEIMSDSMKTNINYVPEQKNTKTKKPRAIKRDRTASGRAVARETKKRVERYEAQESKRAPRIQVDQSVVLTSWILGIAIAFLASAIVSFNGITSVATFVGLSQAWMASLFFFFVEIMYLLFLIAYLILASRIDEDGVPENVRGAFWGMVSFGGIAVLANGFHTFDYWEWAWEEPRMWAGVILSISAPIAIISASKMASRVVFAKAVKL